MLWKNTHLLMGHLIHVTHSFTWSWASEITAHLSPVPGEVKCQPSKKWASAALQGNLISADGKDTKLLNSMHWRPLAIQHNHADNHADKHATTWNILKWKDILVNPFLCLKVNGTGRQTSGWILSSWWLLAKVGCTSRRCSVLFRKVKLGFPPDLNTKQA